VPSREAQPTRFKNSAPTQAGARSTARCASNEAQQVEEDRLLAELETLREAQIEIEHSQQLYAELFDSPRWDISI
jgi:methylphosphotriester-DNA--protein-cysteine methyltransferase